MGKSSASPPPAPDPAATAAAQAKLNRETAITQYGLNATNQITPEGTSTYRQVGTWEDGTPRFEQTTALSDVNQKLYDTGKRASQQFGDIATRQLDTIGNTLAKPLNLSNEATEARLMELGRKRLDPLFAQRREQMAQRLANQGIPQGSEAWTRAMEQQGQQESDAYNQLLLGGRGQAVQEALTERNQPINEITGMLSGTQIGTPQFGQTPQVGVAGADITGPTMAKYQGELNAYNAKQQQQSSALGSLFGLGGAVLGGWAGGPGGAAAGSRIGKLFGG